jgi:uncharacterized protein
MASRRLLIQILSIIVAIFLSLFAVGHLLTGNASTAVGTLMTDLSAEPVQFSINSAFPVHGWLVYGEPGNGVVLLAHSIRSNRLEMLSRARFLNQQGYSVLLIDLQAHGESPGARITFGARESQSIEAAAFFLSETFPHERIGAIGVSLGAAAIVLAKLATRLDAVILESLHSTIEEAVENRLKLHFGEYGSMLLPLILFHLSFYLDIPIKDLNPIEKINNLNSPLLLISGTNDAHTTLPETERLFAAARDPKEIWIIPGAGHFNMHSYAGRTYENRISAFLLQYLR